MKKIVALALLCFLGFLAVISQDVNAQNSASAVLKDFMRASKMDGQNLTFVLINDKTLDLLFGASDSAGKDSIKAGASQGTAFFVFGVAENDTAINYKFSVEQDGLIYSCVSKNIENFDGSNVAKGQKIKGILQLEKKLNLNRPFVIKSSSNKLEFKLSQQALRQM